MNVVISFLILFHAHGVHAAITDDWYTSCPVSADSKKDRQIFVNGKTYSVGHALPGTVEGVSVYLGKDWKLAQMIKSKVLNECTGLIQGNDVDSKSTENPYSDLYNQLENNQDQLIPQAVELLKKVNTERADQALDQGLISFSK